MERRLLSIDSNLPTLTLTLTITLAAALAFLHMLPKQFTTAEAIRIGEAMGIKESAVAKKLTKLTSDYYIGKVRQGVFVKTTKNERDKWKNKCTPLAA